MPTKTYIYSWNKFSEGAKALAQSMGVKRLKHEGSRVVGSPRTVVINWGSSTLPDNLRGATVINRPDDIRVVSNKLSFFRTMQASEDAPRTPDFTDDRAVAQAWLNEGTSVCIRHRLTGSGAEGLVIQSEGELPNAPLYTKYVKKRDEYRVHVVDGNVIDVQRKAQRTDWEGERNTQIRNLANGYIFARQDVDPPQDVLDQSVKAMAASNLTFGAVDCIWNERQGNAYVLEVNSAPGLMGTTLERYTEALNQL